MAQYPAPIYEETFNIENFSNLNSFQYLYSVAKTNISNSFTAAQTFLNQVFIDGILAVRDLSVVNSFLGYPIIKIHLNDKQGKDTTFNWYPSEYLYRENVNSFCFAADKH